MPIEGQAEGIRKFCDDLALESEGMTQTEALAKRVCVVCKELALPKCYSKDGRREYNISATCEKCFDDMFAESDEGTDDDDGDPF